MSRESKIFTANSFSVQDQIMHYESFGWELLNIDGYQVSMTRETQNPVYTQLVKYEYEYKDLCKKLDTLQNQKKFSYFKFKTFLLLLILFVIPAAIYVYVLVKRKKENEEIDRKISETMSQIQKVCDESRAVFFGKQN